MAAWEGIVAGALSATTFIVIVLVIGTIVVIGVLIYLNNIKKYQQFDCVIWQIDGFGQLTQKKDIAGIFVDKKTKNKRLFMKKANVGLNPDNIPYIPCVGGRKKIYLLQTGLKNFKYIKPNIGTKFVSFTVGEEDVNWAVNAYDRQKQLFSEGWLAKYLPFIILAFVCMIILILFMQLFKQFPLIKEMMGEMREISRFLAQAKTGTTIIPT